MRAVALLGAVSVGAMALAVPWGWPGIVLAVLAVSAVLGCVCLRGDVIVLRAMRAYPVGEAEQPALYRAVRELSVAARVPMPTIHVSPTRAVNSFAVGRRPARAAVCCTEGALALFDERELRAVVGHELAHIRRRDTLVGAAVAVVASLVMAPTGANAFAPGPGRAGPGRAARLLLVVLAPLAAGIVRAGVGSRREYDADADAARITGDPLGLASALRQVDHSTRRLVLPPERQIVAMSHLMLATPVHRAGVARLFGTHPPMAERVARLEQRAGYRR
ncbi:M48 family metalloprotease [Haloactinopolyspora alba]|nr:M48 family metalloprotease [Haloactinopolyspora alba]